MRLTVYTDYSLRVLMFLSLRWSGGELSTIDQIAQAYGISRNHLTKVVHDFSRHGLIESQRGRSGGIRLARAPQEISVGQVVRLAEEDFALVECHEPGGGHCAIAPACQLQRVLGQAMQAFLAELDKISLHEAVAHPARAQTALGITPIFVAPRRR
ncbi:RrF2 family transcriptional regulator [Roseateles sp. BYS180W]|uniref:RrF2 family transcriptional regulator n=1 Tax=Roseateles rivi TaxID=3299028 RepID=A0ABW7FRW6_9BURK